MTFDESRRVDGTSPQAAMPGEAHDTVRENEPRHVLLLQGPVGPFFGELAEALKAQGARVTRVLFNGGDQLFGRNEDVRFSGDEESFEAWLRKRIATSRLDAIVFFGCKRPAHLIAARVARETGIPVTSLEEGYVRTGYVTCERNGNNNLSPIAGKLPEHNIEEPPPPPPIGPNFKTMNWYGFLYYWARIWLSRKGDAALFHRPLRGAIAEAGVWLKNIWRLATSKLLERGAIERLVRGSDGDYLLVPLQMPADSQLGHAARGWTLERLAESIMDRFAAQDRITRLVIKLHPLDANGARRARDLRAAARARGIGERVLVLHSGSIAQLTQHSTGMVTINSTSGLTAIHHGVPLLVMGDAVFRNDRLALCGENESSIDAFLAERETAPLDVRRNYERFLVREALVPGDFYLPSGRRVAATNVAQRILESVDALVR